MKFIRYPNVLEAFRRIDEDRRRFCCVASKDDVPSSWIAACEVSDRIIRRTKGKPLPQHLIERYPHIEPRTQYEVLMCGIAANYTNMIEDVLACMRLTELEIFAFNQVWEAFRSGAIASLIELNSIRKSL